MLKRLKNGLPRISRKWKDRKPVVVSRESLTTYYLRLTAAILLIAYRLPLTTSGLYCQTSISYPIYICAANNPNDYRLFANGGGWDGFWYVGYNRVWIERILVPQNLSEYKRAFIGAKLGRMKSAQVSKNGKDTLDSKAIPGDFYMALSSTMSWKKSAWKFLTATGEIPFEGSGEIAIEQAGESRWFWTEVPLNEINFGGENYIALWSTSSQLTDPAGSPILAAAWGNKEENSYIMDKTSGVPPQVFSTSTLASAITIFEPAIAIKFIPEMPQRITVGIMGISAGEEISGKRTIYASVLGNEIEKSWLEVSLGGKVWEKHDLMCYTAPYTFSINPKKLPSGPEDVKSGKKNPVKLYIRVCAVDIWENTGISVPVNIFIVDPALSGETLRKGGVDKEEKK